MITEHFPKMHFSISMESGNTVKSALTVIEAVIVMEDIWMRVTH